MTYELISIVWMAVAVVTAFALTRISAPYGRHARTGWGPAIPARIGWMVMEAPALLVAPALVIVRHPAGVPTLVGLALWIGHYANRVLVFPLRLPLTASPMPASVMAMAFGFNIVNGLLVAHALTTMDSALSPRLFVGFALFATGFAINLQSDGVLRRLRSEGGYRVPQGGLFRWVSCPNYLGEIIEWLGFALATWSLGTLAFAVWTIANLGPRALAHHRWYRGRFADYSARRALIPGLL